MEERSMPMQKLTRAFHPYRKENRKTGVFERTVRKLALCSDGWSEVNYGSILKRLDHVQHNRHVFPLTIR